MTKKTTVLTCTCSSQPPGAQTLLNAQLFVAASPHEEYTLPDALWMSGATAPNGDLSRCVLGGREGWLPDAPDVGQISYLL